VGADEGADVKGVFVGESEGGVVGNVEGAFVGDAEGAVVGNGEGDVVVGDVVGALEGCDIKSNSQHTTDSTFCRPCAAPE